MFFFTFSRYYTQKSYLFVNCLFRLYNGQMFSFFVVNQLWFCTEYSYSTLNRVFLCFFLQERNEWLSGLAGKPFSVSVPDPQNIWRPRLVADADSRKILRTYEMKSLSETSRNRTNVQMYFSTCFSFQVEIIPLMFNLNPRGMPADSKQGACWTF